MPEHRIGTREEWQAARDELLKAENEHAERSEELAKQRRELPWVRVEKEYTFDTDQGKKTLAELFDGRSKLLAYNIMFGPDYTVGACPGCSNLADHLDAAVVHLNHRDVTVLGFSRAPLSKIQAYRSAWAGASLMCRRTAATFPSTSASRLRRSRWLGSTRSGR